MLTKAAGKRFVTVSSAYYSHSISAIVTLFKGISGGTNNLTTAKASGRFYTILTGGGNTKHRVYAVAAGLGPFMLSKTVFLKF